MADGPAATMAAGQLVEHVAADGSVIEVVTRSDVRTGRLRHRCTYVVVVDGDDRVIVHRRADWKDVYPGWWDLSFGGICAVGEDWVSAAKRELAEEAGIGQVALWPLGAVRYDADDGRVIGEVYLACTDAEPSCPDGEVVEVERVPLATIDQWLAAHQVCLDSVSCVVPLLSTASDSIDRARRATASSNRSGSPDE